MPRSRLWAPLPSPSSRPAGPCSIRSRSPVTWLRDCVRSLRTPPEGLGEDEVLACLAEGWDMDGGSLRFLPVGFGSYHWEVAEAGGRRHFVTVDDLDVKGWLRHDRDCV